MLEIRTRPGDRLIELGCGSNPNPSCHVHVDIHQRPGVDFTADFNRPLPIQDSEFDGVLCQYALEHISYTRVPAFLAECRRILKSGGKAVFLVPDTEAQLKWIQANQGGWDDKDLFESASCLLFGDQRHSEREQEPDYGADSHKVYLSPAIVHALFAAAGFVNITTSAFGTRNTDLLVEAVKSPDAPTQNSSMPITASQTGQDASKMVQATTLAPGTSAPPDSPRTVYQQLVDRYTRAGLFDKAYFNGGGKIGGYLREGYWDFPSNVVLVENLLKRRPKSVLDVGCGRGYILKRLQDRGIRANGLDISRHAWMTRVCDGIIEFDVCNGTPWPFKDGEFDMCLSVNVLQHLPEERLPHVLSEMQRVTSFGLHGVTFDDKYDGQDKSIISVHNRDWWLDLFRKYLERGYSFEILDRDDLTQGVFPQSVLQGDGKLKLNAGSFSLMFHHGWTNLDIHDLAPFAQANGYHFVKHDLKNPTEFKTGSVDMVFSSHCIEHLDYRTGLAVLRDFRRIIKPDGVMRLLVPDAGRLCGMYAGSLRGGGESASEHNDLGWFDEINDECAACTTQAGKLHALLYGGHSAIYDENTLSTALKECGWVPFPGAFRQTYEEFKSPYKEKFEQMDKESLGMTFGGLSLFVDAIPLLSK